MTLLCRQPGNLIVDFVSGFYEEKIQKWQTYLYRKPTLEDVDLAMQDGVIVHDRYESDSEESSDSDTAH